MQQPFQRMWRMERRRRACRRQEPASLTRLAVLCVAVLLSSQPSLFAEKQELSDDLIYDRVIRELANDRQLKTTALKVEVEDRVVTVSGSVRTEKLRQRVTKAVKRAKGVKEVVNNVEVRP